MKTLLSVDDLINHMKNKGIKFNIISEDEAKEFLNNNNYYFKLAAYRSLYPKIDDPKSKKIGQYQNLEFVYLKELSIIDMRLRYLIIDMCLDIEHAIKVRLVHSVSDNPQEDGYTIVKSYLNKEDKDFRMLKTIRQHKSGEYCKDLINKYYPFFPIWVLVEVISFGDLLHISQFYENTYNASIIPNNKFMNTVRDLRNASAHSNCLINNMTKPMESSKQPDHEITHFVKEFSNISDNSRLKYLHRTFTYNIVTLLYVYNYLMPDEAKDKRFKQLHDFMTGRVLKHKEYFQKNSRIIGVYNFLNKVIDNLNKE